MEGLKELILKEEKRLKGIKEIVDSRLADVPDGTLRVTTSKNNIQYIQCTENSTEQGYKLSYIKKQDMSLAYRLAQKSYDQKIKRIVDRRAKQLQKLAKEYEDNEIEEIYDKLHYIRKTMINPVEIPWEQRLAEWKSVPYVGKEFRVGMPEIYTKKGERVRSKSEKILADTFYDLGIEYKYECPLKLKGYGVVYPDFTFLRKRDLKEIYWEHDGRIDDPLYSEKAVKKINSYISSGILPGDRLILTFETTNVVLNDVTIRKMVEKFLL
ncbi:MAG: hypothetical protein J5802_02065 [Butyrivibrio sp.]|nr:hypothetical protein [Butyrivibrio sp.]